MEALHTFTEGPSMKQIPYLLAYLLRKVGASLWGKFITREKKIAGVIRAEISHDGVKLAAQPLLALKSVAGMPRFLTVAHAWV